MQATEPGPRLALVAGATGGIGRRFARVLAADGLVVGLGGRDGGRLEALREEIAAVAVHPPLIVPLELGSPRSIGAAIDALEAAAGLPVTVLVNAIGTNRRKPLLEVAEEDFDLVFGANVRAAFFLCREAARRMIANGVPGRIVNLGSILGRRPIRDVGIYGASKAALAVLTEAMALEWGGSGVAVNAILPGYIETDLTRSFLASGRGQEILAAAPRRRAGRVEDLDGVLRLLTSFDEGFLNGSLVVVDDGQGLAIR